MIKTFKAGISIVYLTLTTTKMSLRKKKTSYLDTSENVTIICKALS